VEADVMAKASKKPVVPTDLLGEINYYKSSVDLHDYLPINVDVQSAQESTMISLLGPPMLPLTTRDQPERASPLVKALSETVAVSSHVVVTGLKPAIACLRVVLGEAFAQEKASGHDFESVLGTEGMLNVRYRKPTSGKPSTKISNHSWGTAIDFKIVGNSAPGNTGHQIPRFIAVLLPFFNDGGWYSGIGFNDTMHFEVSDGKIREWAKAGLFKA
jgi:D-alanyl-D-alanine carboxypeptidase